MKQLTYVFFALLLLSFIGCNRNRAARQYERFQEDSDRIEFITPSEDTVKIEEDVDDLGPADDEDLLVIPDIPQERSVNMGASDYELKKMMSGKGD
ncbi:MAG: hypothetical protein IJQ13_09040 [Prevotella sp.]|nr:hypothetical protein [Prevotella sp.]